LRRSAGAQAVSALCDVAGCTFFNLQVGGRAGEMAALGVNLVDFTAELPDFAASAALVSCLDLVISVDTAVVHLAGGLERPVWMLSRFDCCWRWGRRAPLSAWYPTLRAFYQPTSGDWAGAIAEIRAALVLEAAAHAAKSA
jgi:ADP-heptose:LPS heptosyltransferase